MPYLDAINSKKSMHIVYGNFFLQSLLRLLNINTYGKFVLAHCEIY